MKWAAIALACALPGASALAQDSVIEISEDAVNRLVQRLGNPSDGGIFVPTPMPGLTDCVFFGALDCGHGAAAAQQPGAAGAGAGAGPAEAVLIARCKNGDDSTTVASGQPVVWQWWVTEARFDARAGALEFSAKVRYRVGDRWDVVTRSVPASVAFDQASGRLRLNLQPFKVPLDYSFVGVSHRVAEVDVGRLYNVSLATQPQRLDVPLHNYTKAITARVVNATAQFEQGLIRVNLELRFQ